MNVWKSARATRAVLVILSLAVPAAGAAETKSTSAEGPDRALSEIVVTARRVDESIQKVPGSIGVLSSSDLQQRMIQSVSDLRQAVVNISVAKSPVAGGNIITSRGVKGHAIPNVTVDSSIGIYIDGVYLGRPQSSGAALADISRVEVLRGPQGTLFGRNSSGGAINFITRAPAEDFGVDATLLAGNYDQRRGDIGIDTGRFGPFTGRIAYFHEEYDGDVTNLAAGRTFRFDSGVGDVNAARKLGGRDSDAVLVKLRFDGITGFVAEYKFDRTDQKETSVQGQLIGFPSSVLARNLANIYLLQAPGAVYRAGQRLDTLNLDFAGEASIKSGGHMLALTKELRESMTLKSISAYRDVKTFSSQDTDGGAYLIPPLGIPFAGGSSVNVQKQHQVSQELQLIAHHQRWNYIVGAYYFRERGQSDLTRFSFDRLVPGPGGLIAVDLSNTPTGDLYSGQRERVTNTSYAAYSHLEYRLTDRWDLAGGVRHTVDNRESTDARFAPFVSAEKEFNRTNYDVSLTYSPSDAVNLYARHATGYLSGGVLRQAYFKPEESKSTELGVKSELFDRRLRLNAAAYRQTISEQQVTGFVESVGLFVTNVGSVKIEGFELEASARPFSNLMLSANYGYNNPVASSGEFPRAPKKMFAFSGEYEPLVFNNGMRLSIDLSGDYRSGFAAMGATAPASRFATGALPAVIWASAGSEQAYVDRVFADATLGGYWLANARVSLKNVPFGGGRTLRISGFVNNLFDEDGLIYGVNSGAAVLGIFERPRTYGVEFSASFR